ncbi:MAG: phenylacetate--CoA ligase family protein [Acidimicrobiales bacterium]|jgi:phenylacetate-coenzyme A ligase PaaK-like adenylate-forming protein
MSDYELRRQQHIEDFLARISDHIARIDWPPERIHTERRERLRELVRVAKERSPWHRERLADVDPETLDEEDLPKLPVMTKDDLMTNFDESVTDPRVTLAAANTHIKRLTSDDYFLGDLHIVASGGSSGRRGVFVYAWEAWTTGFAGFARQPLRDKMNDPDLGALPNIIGVVAADHPWHMTSASAQTFSNPFTESHRFPVTLPVAHIVAGLNRVQPTMLVTYASALAMLVEEARAGRLRIDPKRITSTSEPLLPEIRAAAEEIWGAPVANWWGTSEGGPTGVGCFRGRGMHLSDDLLIIEPVNDVGSLIGPDETASKIYLTNLFNPIQPLIRYEITDEVKLLNEPCPCGSVHRRVEDIQGRLDDRFVYGGGIAVHPHLFRSALAREPSIVEYQVRQTPSGAVVLAVTSEPFDAERLGSEMAAELALLGVQQPAVAVRTVDRIDRQAIGKLKRFVPLEPTSAR